MISDVEARRIASEWHGGGGSALYVLSSTGAIVLGDQGMEWLDVWHEVKNGLVHVQHNLIRGERGFTEQDEAELNGLLSYVEHHGSRGPIEGWGNLSW